MNVAPFPGLPTEHTILVIGLQLRKVVLGRSFMSSASRKSWRDLQWQCENSHTRCWWLNKTDTTKSLSLFSEGMSAASSLTTQLPCPLSHSRWLPAPPRTSLQNMFPFCFIEPLCSRYLSVWPIEVRSPERSSFTSQLTTQEIKIESSSFTDSAYYCHQQSQMFHSGTCGGADRTPNRLAVGRHQPSSTTDPEF